MESQQQPVTPTLSAVVSALADLYRRFTASIDGHHQLPAWTEDVAFSDELERELIRRELHGAR